jgi:hypothetical protein
MVDSHGAVTQRSAQRQQSGNLEGAEGLFPIGAG